MLPCILRYALIILAMAKRSCGAHFEGQRVDGQRFLGHLDEEQPEKNEEQPEKRTSKPTLTPMWSTSLIGKTSTTRPVLIITTSPLPTAPPSTTTRATVTEAPLTPRQLKALLPQPTEPPTAKDVAQGAGSSAWISRVIVQLVFGVAYYYLIVRHYPKLMTHQTPNIEVITLQEKSEVAAVCSTSWPNLFHSFCCSGPRAAHTFHSVGIMSYWLGFLLMTCCPCCTLFLANSFTDLNARLGGEARDPFMSFICACFCSCCVIAQDAESLDLMSNLQTGFFRIDNPDPTGRYARRSGTM